MSDDPRFWSFAVVSVLLVALWAVESGRTGLLKTVWTTPDASFSTGANYQAGQTTSSSSSHSSGTTNSGLFGGLIGGSVGSVFSDLGPAGLF
jgi:hypothetical protein